MILSLALSALAAVAAFLVGYALNQGTTCAVTAARQMIDERRSRMLLGFGVASAAAGLVWLPLAWLSGSGVSLTPERAIGGGLLLGAVLLGVGAVLNRACILGSISRIGDGRLSFLGMPVGLALGFALADRIGLRASADHPNPLGHFSLIGVAVLGLFAGLGALGWWWMRRMGDDGDAERWPWRIAMVVLGVAGAVLFAVAPGWTVADAVRFGLPHQMSAMTGGAVGLTMFTVLVAGAITSGLRRKSFRYRRPRLVPVARSVAGGATMALGASLVPGGNDALLLAALPAGTLSGLAAYLVMSGTVFVLLLAGRWRAQQSQSPAEA